MSEGAKGLNRWQRIKSATGWGLFLGICDWVLASGITNKIPREGVWVIILAQVLVGLFVGAVRWSAPWWGKGILYGIGVNVPLCYGLKQFGPAWGKPLFWPLLASGLAIGLFIEWVIKRKG